MTPTLIERLRASAQGITLGAEGMGWAPEELYEEAASRIEYLQEQLAQIRFTASVAIESEREEECTCGQVHCSQCGEDPAVFAGSPPPPASERTTCNHPPDARGLTGCGICGAIL